MRNMFRLLLSLTLVSLVTGPAYAGEGDFALEQRVRALEDAVQQLNLRLQTVERAAIGGGGPIPAPGYTGAQVIASVNLSCTDSMAAARPYYVPTVDETIQWVNQCRTNGHEAQNCIAVSSASDTVCFNRIVGYRRGIYPNSDEVSRLMAACTRQVFSCQAP